MTGFGHTYLAEKISYFKRTLVISEKNLLPKFKTNAISKNRSYLEGAKLGFINLIMHWHC